MWERLRAGVELGRDDFPDGVGTIWQVIEAENGTEDDDMVLIVGSKSDKPYFPKGRGKGRSEKKGNALETGDLHL